MPTPSPAELDPAVRAQQLLQQLQAANNVLERLGTTQNETTGAWQVQSDPVAIARTVAEGMVEQLGVASAWVWFVADQDQSLQLVAQAGLVSPAIDRLAHLVPDDSPLGQLVQQREPLLSNQLATEPWILSPEWIAAEGLVGFAGYPIFWGPELMGSLVVFSHQPLAAEFMEVLKFIGTHTASMWAHARDYLILHQKAEQEALLHRVSQQLRRATDSDELIHVLVTEVGRAFGAEHSHFWLPNESPHSETLAWLPTPHSYHGEGYQGEESVGELAVARSPANLRVGLLAWTAALVAEGHLSDDLTADGLSLSQWVPIPEDLNLPADYRQVLLVPLLLPQQDHEEVLGWLGLVWCGKRITALETGRPIDHGGLPANPRSTKSLPIS